MSDKTTAIKGGTVIDQSGSRRADVVVSDDGTIVAVGEGLDGDVTLDATDCVVSPGFVDLHVHLRQPGKEEAETIESGISTSASMAKMAATVPGFAAALNTRPLALATTLGPAPHEPMQPLSSTNTRGVGVVEVVKSRKIRSVSREFKRRQDLLWQTPMVTGF